MIETYLRQSPLAHLHLDARAVADEEVTDAGVSLSERSFRGQFVIRGDAADPAFAAAVKKATRLDLPTEACTSSGKPAGTHILWQGPDEWLIVTKPEAGEKVKASLTKELDGQHAAFVDVSDSRTVIALSGAEARNVLHKGCAIDFHPRAFEVGKCVGTHLAHAHAIIHRTAVGKADTGPEFEIYVHRSFAEYLWAWLEDAGREYGVKVEG